MTGLEIVVDDTVAGTFPLDPDAVEHHAAHVLDVYGHDACEVNVVFIDDERMTTLNESYRGKTGTTDVLSFDLSEDREELLEGEVYVSVERAGEQATGYGADTPEELIRLVTHGLLHLCGWTHDTDEDLADMQEETERFVRSFFNSGEQVQL